MIDDAHDLRKAVQVIAKAELELCAVVQAEPALCNCVLGIFEALIIVTVAEAGGSCARASLLSASSGPSLSRAIGKLELYGLVCRRVPAGDRRTVRVDLTELGWDASEVLLRQTGESASAAVRVKEAFEANAAVLDWAASRHLSASQARCAIMLSDESQSAAAVAAACGLKRTTALMALDSLCGLGLVCRTDGRPALFSRR